MKKRVHKSFPAIHYALSSKFNFIIAHERKNKMTNEEKYRKELSTTEALARNIVITSCHSSQCFMLPNKECIWFDSFSAKSFHAAYEKAVEKVISWFKEEEDKNEGKI